MHPRVAALSLVWAAAVGAAEGRAHAQACCASTSTIFPARLQDDENGLIGLAVRGAGVYGSFDGNRALTGQPSGAAELDLGQTVLVTARLFNTVQVNVSVPFDETWRTASGLSDFGGGVSDMSLSLRWDVVHTGDHRYVPGIAPTVSLTVPSGTPVEFATDPLAASATGLGSTELAVGLALEQLFGRTLVALTGSVGFHGSRTVGGIYSQLGPDVSATLGVGYTFMSGFAVGGALTYLNSFDSTLGDADVPGSARALTQLAVTASMPVRKTDLRVLGSIYFVPPIPGLGQNELGTAGISVTLIYGFKNAAGCNCPNGVCPFPRQ
jgi:hypothetical protein